ncbi:ABC transporter permease [Bacillus sp. TL12]|uniref:ABC transporter permease n=1 Tax=Bacillus sp. TL12 TaxID=2894756 RepID=UPI001F528D17|nr:ABC transporter permease [Bacillus sp. TL12]MCI0768124.1 ABC transporter permease [Bacillus sp. TL12]
MYRSLLASEVLKLKRKWVWFLIMIAPIGVIVLQAINFSLRYDILIEKYKNNLWGGLLSNIQSLSLPAILLGITIITSIIAHLEHKSTSWKHLLLLPIEKRKIFIAKFILSFSLLFVSCSILFIGSICLGIGLDFGYSIPWSEVIKISFFPYFSALPILALQLWLSIVYKNQGITLMVGVLGTVLALFSDSLPDWIIWKFPLLASQSNTTTLLGATVGILLILIATFDFVRRDVDK